MNFLLPISAAVLQAASYSFDKFVLSLRGISYRTYVAVSFSLGFIVTLLIFAIYRPPLSTALIQNTFLLLIISIAITTLSNLFYYRALDHDALSEVRSLDLFANIPIIIWSSIIFATERNPEIILLSIIATLAVFWAHFEHRHFKISRFTKSYLLFAITILPFGAIISKELLVNWNPVSLELVRNGAYALIFLPSLSHRLMKISPRSFFFFALTNILTTVAWILYFFSFKKLGVGYTVLIFSLEPLLVYFSALFFFKEKFHTKKFIAFVIVLISIAIAETL